MAELPEKDRRAILGEGYKEIEADAARQDAAADALKATTVDPLLYQKGPYITYILLAVLAVSFTWELIQASLPPRASGLNPQILFQLGGLNRVAVIEYGQWFRLFTAVFLHASFIHIVLNSFALYLAGSKLEQYVGRVWFLTTFLVGGICGSLGSIIWSIPTMVTVGASGAIVAMAACLWITTQRLPGGQTKTKLQTRALQVLVPALLPTGAGGTMQIDYADHIGGAVGGLLIGAVILTRLPQVLPDVPRAPLEPKPATREWQPPSVTEIPSGLASRLGLLSGMVLACALIVVLFLLMYLRMPGAGARL